MTNSKLQYGSQLTLCCLWEDLGFSHTSCRALGNESTLGKVFGNLSVDFQHAYLCNGCKTTFTGKRFQSKGKELRKNCPHPLPVTPPTRKTPPELWRTSIPWNQRKTWHFCTIHRISQAIQVRCTLPRHCQKTDAARIAIIQVASEIMIDEVNIYIYIKFIPNCLQTYVKAR